jgi:hypothetical protein
MRRIVIFSLALIFVSVTMVLAADRPKKKLMDNYIAVFDLETQDVDKKISRPLTESIRRELVTSGKYEVIDRGNMNKILGEQAFQMTGCVAGECVVEAGQLLGVGKIITGSVSIVGKTYYLSLSLINVQSGKIEKVSEDKCRCEVDDLIDSSKVLAKKLIGLEVSFDEHTENSKKATFSNYTSPAKSTPEITIEFEVNGTGNWASNCHALLFMDRGQIASQDFTENMNKVFTLYSGNVEEGNHYFKLDVDCGNSHNKSIEKSVFIKNPITLKFNDNVSGWSLAGGWHSLSLK